MREIQYFQDGRSKTGLIFDQDVKEENGLYCVEIILDQKSPVKRKIFGASASEAVANAGIVFAKFDVRQ